MYDVKNRGTIDKVTKPPFLKVVTNKATLLKVVTDKATIVKSNKWQNHDCYKLLVTKPPLLKFASDKATIDKKLLKT